jgi:signal peptidase I
VLAFFVESEVFAKVTVEKSSMENTLFENQQLMVDVLSYSFHKPERGDIIIFFPNEENGNIINKFKRYLDGYASLLTGEEDKHEKYVKRVIGIEGDVVDIKDGFVYVNGNKLEEPYANGITESKTFELPYTVGKNELFVLGDNREISLDSRYFGPINLNQVEGRAFYSVYPFNKFGKIK